jgi:Na+/melibiose symporter and related transporters
VKAIGLYGATAGIGASLGLVIGGALAAEISWRVGFFINVPIGVAMMVLAPRFLPETPRQPGRFDVTGALTATLGVGALVFGIIHAAGSGWGAPITVGSVVIGAVLMAALVAGERGAQQPIMPLRLFASHERVVGYLTRMLYMAAMMGFFFFTSQYMQGVLGFTALAAGFGFLPMTVVNFVVAMAVPRVTQRLGQNVPLAAGVGLAAVGMLWLAQVGTGSSYWIAVAAPMLLIGIGQGLVFAPVTSLGLAGVQSSDAGAASGLINSFHQVGSAVGLGVLVTVSAHAGAGRDTASAVLTAQVHVALEVAAAILALALLVVLTLFITKLIRLRRTNH